jgi:hypothetical protein
MSTDLHSFSNGRYTLFLSPSGTGYAVWGDLALTRWNADPTEDGDGFLSLSARCRQRRVLVVGSAAGTQNGGTPPAASGAGSLELAVTARGIEARLEVCVPEKPIWNCGGSRCAISATVHGDRVDQLRRSGVEHALAADAAHPAFSKLFIQTEWAAETRALLARRRPRIPGRTRVLAGSCAAGEGSALRIQITKPTAPASSGGATRWPRQKRSGRGERPVRHGRQRAGPHCQPAPDGGAGGGRRWRN